MKIHSMITQVMLELAFSSLTRDCYVTRKKNLMLLSLDFTHKDRTREREKLCREKVDKKNKLN
jgi:hypothetical protein